MIDLHMHSTFSDGSLTPTQLVHAASEINLMAIALTDHDTIDGVPEFMAAETEMNIERIPGVELSAEFGPGTMHILGYYMDIQNAELRSKLEWIRKKREGRNELILERLNELGIKLTWNEVAAYAGSDVVGRPHFAQAMIAHGYVKSKQEVFDKYLAKGKKAYVDRARLSQKDCIKLIKNAGGVAILAHPITLKLSNTKQKTLIEELVSYGLDGIECYYSEYSPRVHEKICGLTKQLGLLMSGGSDFHGAANPAIRLGRGFGALEVPDELLEPLRSAAH